MDLINRLKIIYLIRHGKQQGYSERYLGQKNPKLDIRGRRQAKSLQRYFLDKPFDRIYSSDLIRAAETARIISYESSIEIEYVQKIREINLGKWDGAKFSTIKKNYPYAVYMRGANLENYRPPCGENFSDLTKRAVVAFNKIIKKTRSRTLVVAHAGVNRVIIANMLKMPIKNIFQIKQDYGCVNKILIERELVKIIAINASPLEL